METPEKMFVTFFQHFPQSFSEHFVIKQIHKMVECAEKKYKKSKGADKEYIKYMCKAYHMLEMYFTEAGIDPNLYK